MIQKLNKFFWEKKRNFLFFLFAIIKQEIVMVHGLDQVILRPEHETGSGSETRTKIKIRSMTIIKTSTKIMDQKQI